MICDPYCQERDQEKNEKDGRRSTQRNGKRGGETGQSQALHQYTEIGIGLIRNFPNDQRCENQELDHDIDHAHQQAKAEGRSHSPGRSG